MSSFIHPFQPGAVLRVTGEDAGDYLQSQCSADLSPTRDNLAAYGLWLSRKGKVEGDGFALRRGDADFIIVSYYCPGDALREKILGNVIADEVDIEDQTGSTSGLSLWGEATSELLSKIDLPCPESSCWIDQGKITIFEGRRSRSNGFDLVGPKTEIDSLADELRPLVIDQGGRELDATEAHFARIDAGIAAIPDEIGPNELPQEGFLEKDAVSFEKGCFLGQEVMARLHSLGGVQRKLWSVQTQENTLSIPAELFVEGKPAGILKTRYSNDDKEIGAALLRIKKIKSAVLHGISTEPNAKPTIVPLHEFIS